MLVGEITPAAERPDSVCTAGEKLLTGSAASGCGRKLVGETSPTKPHRVGKIVSEIQAMLSVDGAGEQLLSADGTSSIPFHFKP